LLRYFRDPHVWLLNGDQPQPRLQWFDSGGFQPK
jgi:hypothetical protein